MPLTAVSMQRTMMLVQHASLCREQVCPSINCRKVKSMFGHVARCQGTAGCITCIRVHMLLRAHAVRCDGGDCPVPLCERIRRRRRARAAAEAA